MHLESVMAGTLMTLGTNVLIQMTCVLGVGFALERLVMRRGSAAVALTQRATLVGILFIPAVAVAMHSLFPNRGVYVALPEPGALGGPLGWIGVIYLALSVVWFVGALAALVWLAIGLGRVRRWVRGSEPADADLRERIVRLATEEGIDAKQVTKLDVRITQQIGGPCLIGFHRPVLLLPADRLDRCDDLVLLHELTHLRRGDNLWGLLTAALRAMGWVHPLLWRLCRAHRATSEHACDDAVLAARPNPVAYVKALLDFSDARPLVPVGVPAASLFGRRGELLERSRRLLASPAPFTSSQDRRQRGSATVGMIALVAGSIAAALIVSALFAVHHTATAALAGWAWLWCAMP